MYFSARSETCGQEYSFKRSHVRNDQPFLPLAQIIFGKNLVKIAFGPGRCLYAFRRFYAQRNIYVF